MAIDQDKIDRLKKKNEEVIKKRSEVAAAKKKEVEIDEKNNSEEVLREKDKQEQLQKIKEGADLWEERRNTLKDKTMEISADPQAWLKGFLMKKVAEAGHYAISKKRRLEVAEAKEKESKIEFKNNTDKLKTSKKLEDLEGKPLELNFGSGDKLDSIVSLMEESNQILGSEDSGDKVDPIVSLMEGSNQIQLEQLGSEVKLDSIVNLMEGSNQIQSEQLRQDSDQWKADQRVSAGEEASAGTVLDQSENSQPGSSSGEVKPSGGMKGLFKKPMDGIKGIMGNVLSKFGKAGKFLKGLGTKFLMPLITTPVGWAILAGLAVGGLVFAYWDDIVAFVGKMFDGVKSMFSKVVSKISGMFSAVGNAIKEVISFFNPVNLLPMIARALLPKGMYDAVSSFFGGDTHEERDNRGKRDEAGERVKQAESTAIEADDDLGEAMEVQKSSSADLNRLNRATAVGIFPDGGISIVEDMVNFQHNVPGAERSILKAGARVATPEEISILKQSAEDKLAVADMNVKDLTIKSNAADRESYFAAVEHNELDDLVKGSDQKKKKPGNVVADLVRAGTAEYNVWGDSTIKNWSALQKLDYESLEKVLAFDDWGDKTKKGILGIMDSKKQLIGANDLEPIKPNEIGVLRKDEMVSGALQKGMDNNIAQGSDNQGKKSSDTNIVSAPTVNHNTTIKKEGTHDTDMTSMNLNKSAFPQQGF